MWHPVVADLGQMFVFDEHTASFQIILTRCGVVQPSLTRQLVSGTEGVGESAADSLKYILLLEVRYGGGVFG